MKAIVHGVRSELGRKTFRYAMVSVVSVLVGQSVLIFCSGVLDWPGVTANLVAVSVGSIPSYLLNRYWAWGKRGRNHLFKEVLPFWGLALLGLGFSTLSVDYVAGNISDAVIAVQLASLSAFGVLWVGKFILLNEVLFKHHPEVLEEAPALDGTTGVPT